MMIPNCHRIWQLPAIGVCLAACASDSVGTETTITVTLASNFPADLDRLTLVSQAGSVDGGVPVQSTLALKEGDFPFHYGFRLASTEKGALDLNILADNLYQEPSGGDSKTVGVIDRALKLDFWPGRNRSVTINLGMECARLQCASGKTCIPGWGCVRPDLGDDGSPVDRQRGPECNCQSFWPVCVGPYVWKIRVKQDWKDPAHPDPAAYEKTLVNADHGTVGMDWKDDNFQTPLDIEFGKTGKTGFILARTDYGQTATRRFFSLGQEADKAAVTAWERDHRYDANWNFFRFDYYVPSRLRLDENRTTIGETWTIQYDEINVPVGAARTTWHRTDTWAVISPDEEPVASAIAPYRSKVPAREILCQHRRDVGMSASDPVAAPRIDDQTYCFIRGVGKIYEKSDKPDYLEEEWLTSVKTSCTEAVFEPQ